MEAPCPLITPTVEFSVSMIELSRSRMLKVVDGLSSEQLHRIPHGFKNNLLWNLGHVIPVMQAQCYEKSGLPFSVPNYILAPFVKGTSPLDWTGTIDVEEVKTWLLQSVKTLREDLHKNAFHSYEAFVNGAGAKLSSISDALAFVSWHESLHLGIMMSLRKLV